MVLLVFYSTAMLVGVAWYLTGVLMCSSLVASETELLQRLLIVSPIFPRNSRVHGEVQASSIHPSMLSLYPKSRHIADCLPNKEIF